MREKQRKLGIQQAQNTLNNYNSTTGRQSFLRSSQAMFLVLIGLIICFAILTMRAWPTVVSIIIVSSTRCGFSQRRRRKKAPRNLSWELNKAAWSRLNLSYGPVT